MPVESQDCHADEKRNMQALTVTLENVCYQEVIGRPLVARVRVFQLFCYCKPTHCNDTTAEPFLLPLAAVFTCLENIYLAGKAL